MYILAVGAHPDDVEIGCGGTLKRYSMMGHNVIIVDLTAGEMASNGSPEGRRDEALQAAQILGASERHCINLPDGRLGAAFDESEVLSELIRKWKPDRMLIPYGNDQHPDHRAANVIARQALFRAGLKHSGSVHGPHRGAEVLEYYINSIESPDRYFDITDTYKDKRRALECHKSQFILGESSVPTSLNQGFLDHIQVRDQYWGYGFKCSYAEVFKSGALARLDLITAEDV